MGTKIEVIFPPNLEDMEIAMSDLEKYINAEDGTASLVNLKLYTKRALRFCLQVFPKGN